MLQMQWPLMTGPKCLCHILHLRLPSFRSGGERATHQSRQGIHANQNMRNRWYILTDPPVHTCTINWASRTYHSPFNSQHQNWTSQWCPFWSSHTRPLLHTLRTVLLFRMRWPKSGRGWKRWRSAWRRFCLNSQPHLSDVPLSPESFLDGYPCAAVSGNIVFCNIRFVFQYAILSISR